MCLVTVCLHGTSYPKTDCLYLVIDLQAYSNASSGFSIAITISTQWQAWQLASRWRSQGRDIQWAKAISFKLLAICLCTLLSKGKHLMVPGDNQGLSKAGGRDVVPIDQQIESFVASSSFQRIAIERYTQSMSQVHRTPQTLPHGASTAPPPPLNFGSPVSASPMRSDPSSLMFDPGELAKRAVFKHLVHM